MTIARRTDLPVAAAPTYEARGATTPGPELTVLLPTHINDRTEFTLP
jgi:hypothetical protein